MALELKKTYATDQDKEVNGVWEDFGEGCRILIARAGNKKYDKLFQRLVKPHRKAMRMGTLSDEVAEGIFIRTIAETIVLDWEGLEEDGVPVPYSVENAIRILTEYEDLKKQIQEISDSIETYRLEVLEDSEKNLETISEDN